MNDPLYPLKHIYEDWLEHCFIYYSNTLCILNNKLAISILHVLFYFLQTKSLYCYTLCRSRLFWIASTQCNPHFHLNCLALLQTSGHSEVSCHWRLPRNASLLACQRCLTKIPGDILNQENMTS